MSVTVLKDLLLSQGFIDRYFEGTVPVHLWRGLNRKKGAALFDLVEEPVVLAAGRLRPRDIDITEHGGTRWVTVAHRPRGISTFDRPGVPAGMDWSYYQIPAGTVIPAGLAIVRDEFNARFGATHYTLAPAFDMPLDQFKRLLRELAANAIKEVA